MYFLKTFKNIFSGGEGFLYMNFQTENNLADFTMTTYLRKSYDTKFHKQMQRHA